MSLLFTGRGTSGSWQIRGVQLGAACGAVVQPSASLEQCRAADLIVVVKRCQPETLEAIRKSKRPWVWDFVDSFPQPLCASWSREKSIQWVRSQLKEKSPHGVIWPCEAMQECGKGFVLYHHHNPAIKRREVPRSIKTVSYEGSERYLSDWRPVIKRVCADRGWRFTVNQGMGDVAIAVRGRGFNGYPQSHWKSNVKLANAHAAGVPFVGNPEPAYIETSVGGERFINYPHEIGGALDSLDHASRADISERFFNARYAVEDAAADMLGYLQSV